MRVALSFFGIVLASPILALAQAVPPPLTPGQIQQLSPTGAPRLAPPLRPPPPAAVPGAEDRQLVRITGLDVLGNTALTKADLLRDHQGLVGRDVARSEIDAVRVAITSAYGRAGYPYVTAGWALGRDGQVVITVVEAEIVSVKLDGSVGPADTQILRFLNRLKGGPITLRRLERALLLAGDIPGVRLRSVIRAVPGGASGAFELVAQVNRDAFSGYFSLDNRGYRLTGPLQGLVSIGANSNTSFGERIEATLFQTQDWEQSFGQVAGEAFVGDTGLRVRLYAGAGRSRPGSVLAQIGYQGDTTVAGIAAQYPIIRTRPLNLFAVGAFDYLNSEVDVGNPSTRQSLDEVRALRFGFDGQARDDILSFLPGAGTTQGSIRVHRGLAWLGATGTGEVPGPGRVDSDFQFTKWSGEISRTQPVLVPFEGGLLSLYGLAAGQRSSDVLPLSEKFILGGNRLGRGFYAGQVSGDTALGASVELQLDVRPQPFQIPGISAPLVDVQPAAQFYLFRDFGRTWENLENDLNRTIESYGGGVRIYLTEQVQLDIEGVRRLTRRVDAAGGTVNPLAETAGFFRLLTRF